MPEQPVFNPLDEGHAMISERSRLLNVPTVCAFLMLTAAAAYAAPAPCSLLTEAQVTSMLGINPGPGKPVGSKGCDWVPAGQPIGINAKKVTLTLMDAQMFGYATMPMSGKGSQKKDVSGIGDQAVFAASGKIGTLLVKKGSVAFALHVYGFPVDQIEAKEKTLAAEIVARL